MTASIRFCQNEKLFDLDLRGFLKSHKEKNGYDLKEINKNIVSIANIDLFK